MKRNIYLGILLGGLMLTGCQNELYKDPVADYQSGQGAYIASDEMTQIFVEEGKEILVKNIILNLTQKEDSENTIQVEAGSQAQLDAYNKKHATEYLMLPPEMYEVSKEVKFGALQASQILPLKLKNVKFSMQGSYALPVKLSGGSIGIIPGQDEALLVLEQRINTKCLRMSGYGSEKADMFPNDFKVDQWTMEMMINRASYSSNNRALGGTKLVSGSSTMDEIYTRFGDVTIQPNQLQMKTGGSQIDVPKDKFVAQPNEWYMLAFVYDGKKNSIYVNGELVADREIRTGPYGMIGFWLSGTNELIREVRFWKTARTPQQLKAYAWKMVDGNDDNLLLYYPLNGKKRNVETGEITEDESQLWDWSKNGKDLPKPSGAIFDDNGGEGFTFPLDK